MTELGEGASIDEIAYASRTGQDIVRRVAKEFNLKGAGSYIRKSELADAELNAKYPFLPLLDKAFEKGDGDYRPRIPEYPEIQDILGTAVNSVLVGNSDPKSALDAAQAAAVKLF